MERKNLGAIIGTAIGLAGAVNGCANHLSEVRMFYDEGRNASSLAVIDYDGIKQVKVEDNEGNFSSRKTMGKPMPSETIIELDFIIRSRYWVEVVDGKGKTSSTCFTKDGESSVCEGRIPWYVPSF